MSTLPAAGYLENVARTNAEMKAAFEALRDILAENIGGEGRAELTISSGAVTPAEGSGGGIFRLDTEGDAASDTLDTITQTNTRDGQIIIVMAENAARVVTLNHAAGGAGQLLLEDATDFVFASLNAWVMLQRRSSDWVELGRHVPVEDLTALTSADTADMLEIWDDSAGTGKRITAENLVSGALGAGLVVLATGTATSVAEVEFTGLSATYHAYLLVAHNILPVTDNVSLYLTVSDDGGTTYETSYRHVRVAGSVSGSATVSGGNTDTQIVLASGIGNSAASAEELRLVLWLHDPGTSLDQTSCEWSAGYRNDSNNYTVANGAGHMTSTKIHDAFRLTMSSGNLASMTYTLYGLRK